MKCALELLSMKATSLEELAILEAQEKLRKEQEEAEFQARRKKQVIENTLDWCETDVDEKLQIEASSLSKNPIEVTIPVRFEDDWEEFRLISECFSRRGNVYWEGSSAWMDFKTLQEYLSKYCLKIQRVWKKYPCANTHPFRYGADLIISVANPECL